MTGKTNKKGQNFCPNCTRQGLALLPVRYALASTDTQANFTAPALDAPFGTGVQDITVPENVAGYTLRLLREGYLYVFNEVRGEWKGYEVDRYGCLSEFDIRAPAPPPATESEEKELVCCRQSSPPLSRCIMIPDAANAGTLWLAFTQVAWTPNVLRLHRQAAYRQKHMRRLDLKSWVSSAGQSSQPHLSSMDTLQESVSEYHINDPRLQQEDSDNEVRILGYKAFRYSLHEFRNRYQEGPSVIEYAQQAGEQWDYPPAIVALDDPLGITQELASMMSGHVQALMSREDLSRPLASSAMIEALEQGVKEGAEKAHLQSVQEQAVRKLEFWLPENGPQYDAHGRTLNAESVYMEHLNRLKTDEAYRQTWEAKLEQARQTAADSVTDEAMTVAAQDAWKKYTKCLQANQPGQWKDEVFKKALEKLDKEVVVPLAQAHLAWLRSNAFQRALECHYDRQDVESGVAYCDSVLLCIQDTQTNAISMQAYTDWLSEQTVESENFLLRALALNQDKLVTLQTQGGAGLTREDLAKLPWDKLLLGYEEALKQLSKPNQNASARLLIALGGPVTAALDVLLNRGLGPLVLSLGMIGRAPVVHTRLRGTLEEAVDDLVRRMVQANPELNRLDQDRLRTRMRNQTRGYRRTQRARGVGTRGLNDFEIVVNQLSLEQIDPSMSNREVLRQAGSAVMSFEEWEQSPRSRWQTLTGSNFRIGVVGVLLSLWSMNAVAGDLDKSTRTTLEENTWRYRAAVMGVAGAVSDLLHTMLESSREIGGRFGRFVGRAWLRALNLTGYALGFGAAMIFAFWDGVNFWKERQKNNYGMAFLYLVSAVTSVVAFAALSGWLGTIIFGLSTTGVGIVLAVIAILAGILIVWLKDDELEEWLRRCWFGSAGQGKDPRLDGRFDTLHEESEALEFLLKAE